jgi:hypothetical protein
MLHVATARFAAKTFSQDVRTGAEMGRHITGKLLSGLHRSDPLERTGKSR